jgi:hypothetical protein
MSAGAQGGAVANELTVSVSARYSNGGVQMSTDDFGVAGIQVDVSGTEIARYVQSVGTSEEALLMPTDIGTPGFAILKNLDPTNYISVQSAQGATACVELKPGEPALFRFARTATDPYVTANTAACRLAVILFED